MYQKQSPVLQALQNIPTSTRVLLVSFFQLSPVPLQLRMVSLFRIPTNNFGSRPSPNSIMDGKVIQLSHLKVTKQSKHMQAIQVVSGIKLALQKCFFHSAPITESWCTNRSASFFFAEGVERSVHLYLHCSTLMIEVFNYSIKLGGAVRHTKKTILKHVPRWDTRIHLVFVVIL